MKKKIKNYLLKELQEKNYACKRKDKGLFIFCNKI